MGGPQYDLLMNPLGAVRQTFESAVASSQPSDADPTAVYRGKDWGIVDLLNQFLFDQGGLAQVPILDASSQKWMQPNTLVRFRGMVQDMLGNEFYIGAFKDGCTWRTNKFMDFSPFSAPPVSETTLWERHLLHCIPVPGQNSWAIESTPYPLKRTVSNETACHHGEKRRRDDNPNRIYDSDCSDEGSSLSNKKQKDFGSACRHRIAEINNGSSFPTSSFSCLVKVYDTPESQFKLNEVVEFIGIYTFEPELIASNNKEDVDDDMMFDFMDDLATHLPPSKVPRIHCLVSRKLSTSDLISNSPAFEPLPNIMRGIRDSLVSYLSCTLGNDVLAAQCLLLHLLSKLRTKSDVASVGRLSLNLTGFTQETASIFGHQLHNVIKTLVPYSHAIPLTVEYLNTAMLQPKKDNQTGRLVMGVLQLAIGTHLTFDETVMQSGTLNSKGVENVQLLKHLMEHQTVEYDFQFYKLEMAAEVQCLIISEAKSNILPADLVVPVCPSAVTPVTASEEQLHAWRWYLAAVRSLPHLTDTSICEMLQNEMVDAMRKDRSLGCADLSRWLTMAQLMAASFGEKILSVEHWQMVKEIERLRKERS
ncbi:E2F target protein 1 (ETG1) [Carex rostrata]